MVGGKVTGKDDGPAAHHSNKPPAKPEENPEKPASVTSANVEMEKHKAHVAIRKKLHELEKAFDAEELRVSLLGFELQEKREKVDSLKKSLEAVRETHPDRVDTLRQQIDQLTIEACELRKIYDQDLSRLKSANKQLARDKAALQDDLKTSLLTIDEEYATASGSDASEKLKTAPKPPQNVVPPNGEAQNWTHQHQADFANAIIPEDSEVEHSIHPTEKLLARQTQGKDLPIFTGRPEEWLPFISAFENTTANCYFSDADNLPRLHKAIKGDALKFVQHLLISPQAVPEAIKMLRMRYGQPEILIKAMMKKISEAAQVKEDKPETIVELGTLVSSMVATINATGLTAYNTNPTLIMELNGKLPLAYQLAWSLAQNGEPTLATFSNFYEQLMMLACKNMPVAKQKPDAKEDKRGSKPQKTFSTHEKKSDDRKSDNKKPEQRKCAFCSETGHRHAACPEFAKSKEDERQSLVMKARLCFGCLNRGHSTKECRIKKPCGIYGCEYEHHRLLHRTAKVTNTPKTEVPPAEASTSEETVKQAAVVNMVKSQQVHFMMTPVTLIGPKGTVEGFAVLDSYSSMTSIDEETAKKLGVTGTAKPLEVESFGATVKYPQSKLVWLDLIPRHDCRTSFRLGNVRTVKSMNLPTQSLHRSDIQKWSHLKGIEFPLYNNEKPIIMIGDDNAFLSDVMDTRYAKNPNAPRAILTPLGWVLRGKFGKTDRNESCFHVRASNPDQELHDLVKQHFALESMPISSTAPKPKSTDVDRAQSIIDSTMKQVQGGWEIGLLYKDDNPVLPRSRNIAEHRLKLMERKMNRDPAFATTYQAKIGEYLEKGFARMLSPDEAKIENAKTFYLPHFMAWNPKKGKYRFVFDAAAKAEGRSLNDFLLPGPDNLVPLIDILLKFRQRKIAISADIKDMFHKVRIREEDRCSQRFLWRGMARDLPPQVYQMEVMIFGATCSPSCAQEVKNRNALDFKDQYPEAFVLITQLHYVDDFLGSYDTVEEAVRTHLKVRTVQMKGGFHLCNFLSNSKEVLESIPRDLHAKSMKDVDLDKESPLERLLGLYYKPETDEFTFSLQFLKTHEDVLQGRKLPTKRELLSLAMSPFDPMGYISHFTIKAKMLLQMLWRTGTGWDDTIPESVAKQWHQWREDLHLITNFSIPRCYSPNLTTADSIELHIFGDGSEEAYGSMAFLLIKKGDVVDIALVMSKARVAPIKGISINRMELQAAVLSAKIMEYLLATLEYPIDRIVLWTDSANVLIWIRADGRKFQQFVSHRIGEIQEKTEVDQWRWVPTHLNPADEMTRLATPCDLSPNSVRVKGPDFLRLPESEWPKQGTKIPKADKDSLEERKQFVHAIVIKKPIMDPTKFSKWSTMVGATTYVLRFCDWIRKIPNPKTGVPTPDERQRAEKLLCRMAQADSFPEEIRHVMGGEPIPKWPKSSSLKKVTLFMDDEGLLRVGGRLQNAKMPIEAKHPIVLDRRHDITKLLVSHYHTKCGHHGHERIGNEIRQLFFIPSLRQAVRAAQSQCRKCKHRRAVPQIPQMGQLPPARLRPNVRPFTNCGVDYFGPIEVVVKRSREKRWVALFTCLSTRAIHLELARSLSTDSFILALRRFVARRGSPTNLYSDNGTNFVGSNRELKEALAELDQDKISDNCASQGIQWTFIPPSAPHMGGSWERMVRSVKVALGDTLTLKNLHDETLETLLCEAEHTVNSHPLTHVPDDPEDPEALTPNHFLLGRSSNLQPVCQSDPSDLLNRKQWRIVQQMANHFWRRWVREFLPTLLRQEKWCQPTRLIQVGDVVVEIDETNPRNTWPKARVSQLFPGQDGKVRVVTITRGNGKDYKRPVSKLCVLDLETAK